MALPPDIREQAADGIVTYYAAIAEAGSSRSSVQNAPPPFAAGIGLTCCFADRRGAAD